ncbi:hypothetical protein [Terricaulis sp.]|uniref:hypothetical protein n=1 Tax=Terricaulis sp. TaxID=2768686 RepID=UPI002AC5DF66|nr:hypothetical protein [Terricaulis sp.]MDZ4690831.1 hypothetical protein [Terricaulis sp.]
MSDANVRINVASAFVAAAAAWPSALCAITDAMATPLQRALQSAWCGAGPQAPEFLGHCPACWSGTAAFLLAAAFVIYTPSRQGRRATA